MDRGIQTGLSLALALGVGVTTVALAGHIEAGDRMEMAAVLKAPVTPTQAVKIAESSGGRAYGYGMEANRHGQWYEVDVLRGGAKLDLRIDPTTGKVLGSSAASGEDAQGARARWQPIELRRSHCTSRTGGQGSGAGSRLGRPWRQSTRGRRRHPGSRSARGALPHVDAGRPDPFDSDRHRFLTRWSASLGAGGATVRGRRARSLKVWKKQALSKRCHKSAFDGDRRTFGMRPSALTQRFAALLLLCICAAAPMRPAVAANGPFGIDHLVHYDNSGIWARHDQKVLMGATILTVGGDSLSLGDQDKLGVAPCSESLRMCTTGLPRSCGSTGAAFWLRRHHTFCYAGPYGSTCSASAPDLHRGVGAIGSQKASEAAAHLRP